jgi:hypothetical protein
MLKLDFNRRAVQTGHAGTESPCPSASGEIMVHDGSVANGTVNGMIEE